MPEWRKYVAVVERGGVNETGSQLNESELVIFDTIPRSSLLELAKLNFGDPPSKELPFDFFILTTNLHTQTVLGLLENDGWIGIQVTNENPQDDQSISARAWLPSEDEEAPQFWIRLDKNPLSQDETNILRRLTELDEYADSSEQDLLEMQSFYLSTLPLAVAVYDVGQASFSAIVNRWEHPLVFFDVGWPLNFNGRSKPNCSNFNPFSLDCPSNPAPVVLSHFDWDHWGFAYQSGVIRQNNQGNWVSSVTYKRIALERPWLVRRPQYKRHNLGASHIHLIHTLSNTIISGTGKRALRLWPTRKKSLHWGACKIIACTPAAGSITTPAFRRNNESLTMVVEERTDGAKVLLCGDADYPSIPIHHRNGLTGLVAPHHGGAITLGSTPNAKGHGRMVMSTYPGCYPNVPSPDTINEARHQGWQVVMTSDRSQCPRGGCQRGNRLIRLSMTPRCGCGKVQSNCLCISTP